MAVAVPGRVTKLSTASELSTKIHSAEADA